MILSLETSTHNCSVALHNKGKFLACREEAGTQYIHSDKLHVFIEELMREAQVAYTQLEAIAVGSGPGSYTGLRIGVSAAKGLAFGLQVPLIAATGPSILVAAFRQMGQATSSDYYLAPMLDARRMEVYTALYRPSGQRLTDVTAEVLDANTYCDYADKPIYLLGDGRQKALALNRANWRDGQVTYPSARYLGALAYDKLTRGQFEDLAYFEPFYLKSFKAGTPKKLV